MKCFDQIFVVVKNNEVCATIGYLIKHDELLVMLRSDVEGYRYFKEKKREDYLYQLGEMLAGCMIGSVELTNRWFYDLEDFGYNISRIISFLPENWPKP